MLEKQGFQVVCEASDGQETLRSAGQTQPDVAVVDISMPILNGTGIARERKKSAPKTKPILLTQHDVSVKTAESHWALLMKELDVHETPSLVRYAISQRPNRGMMDAGSVACFVPPLSPSRMGDSPD